MADRAEGWSVGPTEIQNASDGKYSHSCYLNLIVGQTGGRTAQRLMEDWRIAGKDRRVNGNQPHGR